MRVSRSKLRSQMAANHRRRTIRKVENKIINRRQMLFLQSLDDNTSER